MAKITNAAGTEIDFDAAVVLMDDEWREEVHMDLAPCTEQEFFDAYCHLHERKSGEEFEPNKANPVW